MGILNKSPKDKKNNDLIQTSVLMMVPAIMISGPLVGLFGGRWLDSKFDTEPILLIIGVILGFGSAGLETYKLIEKAEAFEKEDNDSK